ncbi:hypothetical protein IFM89_000032 [Coptis chinensis]|uniref:Uncharacterized protein n=1 Tax=Coptis chinensis TaxID=261450 RepID=A0A835IHW5_9MAGN|nr:hypothetical protein IFM89_000032 [Coptis chinensis]
MEDGNLALPNFFSKADTKVIDVIDRLYRKKDVDQILIDDTWIIHTQNKIMILWGRINSFAARDYRIIILALTKSYIQVLIIREKLAELYELEEQWSRVAQMLSGIDLDSGIRHTSSLKFIQIACLYLEDDDAVNAEAFINKASFLVSGSQHEVFEKDGSGRVLGLGSGVSKTTLMAGSPYKRKVEEAEKSKLELKSQMDDLKHEVIEGKRVQMEMHMNALLTMQGNNQGAQTKISKNFTSDQAMKIRKSMTLLVLNKDIQLHEIHIVFAVYIGMKLMMGRMKCVKG